jgi:hypothetical protein
VPAAPAFSANASAPPTQVIPPSKVSLQPQLTEVVHLAQSGVDDSVVLSYIQRSPPTPPLTADQILYLRDLGIPANVLQALVEHGSATSAWVPEPAAPSPASTASATQPANPPTAVASGPPPETTDAGYYYDSLAPYGSWLYVPAYGWCWQPTVVAVNPSWRPYYDSGCWYWSDWGWYWNSYYSWGWAPFHYGRWCQYPSYGWIWCPDRVWGPSWVCWRNSPGYCGWAALPPGSCFTMGVGWTYNGVSVGIGFGFGLGQSCFTFVDYNHFCDPHPSHYGLHGRDADDAFHQGHMNNDFGSGSDHHVVNRGVDPKQIETATRSPVRQVAVREMPRGGGNTVTPGRVERAGNANVVYRPDPQTPAPRNPSLSTLRNPPSLSASSYHASAPGSATGRGEVPHGASLLTPRGQWSAPSGAASRAPAARPTELPTGGRPQAPATSGSSPGASGHSDRPGSAPATSKPQAMYQTRPTGSSWARSVPTYTWNRGSSQSIAPPSSYYASPSAPRSAPTATHRPAYSWQPRTSAAAPSAVSRAPSYSGRSYSAPSSSGRSAPSFSNSRPSGGAAQPAGSRGGSGLGNGGRTR